MKAATLGDVSAILALRRIYKARRTTTPSFKPTSKAGHLIEPNQPSTFNNGLRSPRN